MSHYQNLPFHEPESWKWVRLGDLCDYGVCKNVDYFEITDNAWILDLEDIEKDTAKLLQRVKKADRNTTSTRHSFKKGDVLYSKLRTYLNKVLVADIDGFCTSEILPLDFKGFVIPEYARHVLMSKMFLDYTTQCGYGVKMPRLGTDDGKKALFPLPPFTEQQRIVSVVQKAFALIDEIDSNKLSLQQFIKQSKSKVLDLAIRGKLVPQDPDDEPASALLGRIKNEQKTKKTTADIFPYNHLPEGWIYTDIETAFKITMGQSPDGKSVSEEIKGMEFHQGKIFFTDKYLSKSSLYTTNPTKIAEKGSVLLCVRAPVGVVNISKNEVCIGRGLCAIKPLAKMSVDFTFYWFKTLEKSFIEKSTGSTFQAISMDIIKNNIIPLPPLAEQQRIVIQIEKFFTQLDEVEKLLKA